MAKVTKKSTKSTRYGKRSASQPVFSESSKPVTVPKVYSEKLHVYTDGGTMDNGAAENTGAYAFLIVENDVILYEESRKVYNTTNNRCELQAITDALQWIEQEGISDPVRLFSDSEYCIKGLNTWRHGWKRKMFEGIKNVEMWKLLSDIADRNPQIQYTWVKGHGNNPYNNRCDELCCKEMGTVQRSQGKIVTAKEFLIDSIIPLASQEEKEMWYNTTSWTSTVVKIMEQYRQL